MMTLEELKKERELIDSIDWERHSIILTICQRWRPTTYVQFVGIQSLMNHPKLAPFAGQSPRRL